jgi:hypothetical protein
VYQNPRLERAQLIRRFFEACGIEIDDADIGPGTAECERRGAPQS